MSARILKYHGNPRPVRRPAGPAVIVILPVIHIEHFHPALPRKLRLMRAKAVAGKYRKHRV